MAARNEDAWDSLVALSGVHLAARDGLRLLASAKDLIACDPDHEYGYRMAAEAHLQVGERKEAVRLGREAVARAPGNAFVHYRLAVFLRLAGDLKEAEEHAHKALEVDPEHPYYWVELGHVALESDDPDGARRCADKAIELAPDDADALHLRAQVEKRGTKEEARAALPRFEDALAANPEDPWIWADKAQIHLTLKELDPAEDAARTALSLAPTNPHFRTILFDVLKRRSWVYRILRWPGDLVAKGFDWIGELSWPAWILLWVVGIGSRLILVLLALGLLWLTFVFPVVKLYEWLTTSDLRRKAREIVPRRRVWWRPGTWPMPARIALFVAAAGGFWYGAWRFVKTPEALKVMGVVLVVGVLLMLVLSLVGGVMILRDKRRARRRRRALDGTLEDA